MIAKAGIFLDCMDDDPPGEQAGAWWKDWFPHCIRWKPTRKDPGEMFKTGENVRQWIFEGIRTACRERGIYAGRLDFYEAVDILSKPFSREMIQNLSDEEIERQAIMKENEWD